MDTRIERKHARFPTKARWIGVAALVLLLSGYQLIRPSSEQRVDGKALLIGTVKRGDLDIEVEGYGVLRSDKQKLLTALTSATVEEIVLKPGAAVGTDSVILKLGNPELLQEVERAQQNLSQQQANLRQLVLNNTRDVMTEDSTLAELKASWEAASLRLEGQQKLVEEGIVSRLEYNTTKLAERQLSERMRILTERRAQLLLMQEESINIQREQVKQAMGLHAAAKNRVDHLTVRAGVEGALQNLPVDLGQSVAAGQALALVGSTGDLVALIRVPQTRAERVKVGQRAIVDTRTDKIVGTVARIDPAVAEGTVAVEVSFADSGKLPASARPELSVNGRIMIQSLSEVLYVERPVNVVENSKARLFKLSKNENSAVASELTFGLESGRYIQILSSIEFGDRLILSDMKRFDSIEELTIIR